MHNGLRRIVARTPWPMGFIVSKAGLDELIRGINVDATELYTGLDEPLQNTVISASAVLFLNVLHG